MNKDLKTVLLTGVAVTFGIALYFGVQYAISYYKEKQAASKEDAAGELSDEEVAKMLRAVA